MFTISSPTFLATHLYTILLCYMHGAYTNVYPDEKDRDSSDIDVDKILSATIMVAIFAVLLLALVSCVFCHSKYAYYYVHHQFQSMHWLFC